MTANPRGILLHLPKSFEPHWPIMPHTLAAFETGLEGRAGTEVGNLVVVDVFQYVRIAEHGIPYLASAAEGEKVGRGYL